MGDTGRGIHSLRARYVALPTEREISKTAVLTVSLRMACHYPLTHYHARHQQHTKRQSMSKCTHYYVSSTTPPTNPHFPNRRIILVHGFGLLGDALRGHPLHYPTFGRTIGTDEHVQYYQARHILEEWVQQSAEKLPEPANLRQLTFSTAEVLQHGKDVLCAAAHKLCNSLTSLTLDPDSPLYLGGQDDVGDGDEGHYHYSETAGGVLPVFRSRRVTFVAHGLGIWVVKQALLWFEYHGTPLHPAATMFLDGAKISGAHLVQNYLHGTASLFTLSQEDLHGEMLEDIEAHMFVIEHHFDALMAEAYGECTEIWDGDDSGFRYEMVRYNHQLWQDPSPPLQTYDQYIASARGLGFAHRDPVVEQISSLEFLELEKHLAEAVSLNLLNPSLRAASPDIEETEDYMDPDGAFVAEENTSVASSGSRYSNGEQGPPPTPPSAAELVPAEASQDDQGVQAKQTSPIYSDWLDFSTEENGRRKRSPSEVSAGQPHAVQILEEIDDGGHPAGGPSWPLSDNRETFDFLQMERFIGRSTTASCPTSLRIDASRRIDNYDDHDDDTVFDGSVLFTPASSRVPDSPSESGLLIDLDRVDHTGTAVADTGYTFRPRGPLGWATMSSRGPAVGPEIEPAQSTTIPQGPPRRPLGLATMSSRTPARAEAPTLAGTQGGPGLATISSRTPAENRVSQGSLESDKSTSTGSVLRLYADGASDSSASFRRATIHRNSHIDIQSAAYRESTGLEHLLRIHNVSSIGTQTEPVVVEPRAGESANVLEQALRELNSEYVDETKPQALNKLIVQISQAVEGDMPTLDSRWPNLRRSLRWMLRDFESARDEAAFMRQELEEQERTGGDNETEQQRHGWENVAAATGGIATAGMAAWDDDHYDHRADEVQDLAQDNGCSHRHAGAHVDQLAGPTVVEAGGDDFDYYHDGEEVLEPGGVVADDYVDEEDYS